MSRWAGPASDSGYSYGILLDETFDLAYTSPPYYDTEHYAPGEQSDSMNRYATYEEWVRKFYHVMIKKALAVTTNGFILNVGKRKYDLVKPLSAFTYREIPTRLSGSGGMGKKRAGRESFYHITGTR